MINRQATRGDGARTTKTKPTKRSAAQATVKVKGKAETAAWRGDEVQSPPLTASSAEEAAGRAEGNGPIRADLAASDLDHGTYTQKGPARRPRANDPDADENAEEKRQNAIEDHADLPSRRSPHGRL